MKFEELLPGAWVIVPEPIRDERGFFARTFCAETFRERGMDPEIAQCSVSFNGRKGTVRGMHYQEAPHGEVKLVRCTRGAIQDIVVDIRPGSGTCGKWAAIELSAENGRGLYVPEGFAHGFQTLEDDTEVFYQINRPYSAEHSRGIRWDDPAFEIQWPLAVSCISERDRSFPDWVP